LAETLDALGKIAGLEIPGEEIPEGEGEKGRDYRAARDDSVDIFEEEEEETALEALLL
jgi:hypothetical protein